MTLLPAVLLALTGWFWLRNGLDNEEVGTGKNVGQLKESGEQSDSVIEPGTLSEESTAEDRLVTRLFDQLDLLRQVHGVGEGQEAVAELFNILENYAKEDASRAIVRVLNTRQDALAFGRFAPGKDGFLSAYPSFRTALLDQLEKVDPKAALEMGKNILSESENPDEWALSLRIVARHGQSDGDRVFFEDKVQELLHKGSWLEDPTFSFLHAFDATVNDGRDVTIERLGALLGENQNRAVTHAATVSLDRLFQNQALAGVQYITAHPEFLDGAKGFRASLVARIDPSDTNGLGVVESYLRDTVFSVEEKRTFFQLFPNFNSTFSYNLITESTIPTRTEMRNASVAAVTQLSLWSNENRYPEFQDDINRAIERLAKAWKLEL